MDVLALRADLTKTNRTFTLVVVSMLVPVLMGIGFAVYFLAVGAGYATAIFAIPVVFFLPLLAVQLQAWAATRRITHPVELTPQGLSVDTPEGRLAVGWDAVAALTVTGPPLSPVLGVRFYPQVAPGAPGVVSSLTPRSWRILRRRGMQLAVPLTGISGQDLAVAVGHFSSGRFFPVAVR